MTASEPFRPLQHFTPPRGWINDPNGLVYFNGEWHLFYQFFDHTIVDGMQWGHAVSADLIRWKHLPPAIPPDSMGHIWSGSAVVDFKDSSGLFGGKSGIVCLFTYWNPTDGRQCQGLAFSPDGRKFTTYGRNPVIPELRNLPGQPDDKDFRDPKIFRHAETGRWIMVVAGGKLRIFSSENLIDWKFESVTDSIWTECPDLFELPVDGDAGKKRWVLSRGGRYYMLGRFDGRRFTPETPDLPMTHGPDCYATQTWSDAPGGRRVAIAWLNCWAYESGARPGPRIENKFPTDPWSGGCLTIPYELTIRSTPEGERLFQAPVREFDATGVNESKIEIQPGKSAALPALAEGVLDIDVEITPAGKNGLFKLIIPSDGVGEFVLSADPSRNKISLDRGGTGYDAIPKFSARYDAPLPTDAGGVAKVRIIVDRCSIEVFAGGGLVHFSAIIWPDEAEKLRCESHGANCRLETNVR